LEDSQLQINEIIEWIDGAFGTGRPAVDEADLEALAQLFAGEGYQRYLQDQVNRQIIRDYLANAVLLGVITEGGLAAFAVQLASEEGRSALALHMLMCSVDEAIDLLPVNGQVEALTPLQPRPAERPNIKLVPR
jgi:hypothetical protein